MAYMQGNPVQGLKQTVTRHLFLMVTVSIVLAGMMIAFSPDPMAEISTIAIITLACTALIAFISFKANPLALTMILNSTRFKKAVSEEKEVIHQLERLCDRCYVFNNLTVELFRIDHLVISPWGIFVMGRVRKEGALKMDKTVLHAGEAPLDSLCSNTWRISHLLNIVIRKGWSEEVMPFPVIVPHRDHLSPMKTVDGMAIVAPRRLALHIEKDREEILSSELVDSISAYILKRYAA